MEHINSHVNKLGKPSSMQHINDQFGDRFAEGTACDHLSLGIAHIGHAVKLCVTPGEQPRPPSPKKAASPPPSPVKQSLSEADQKAVNKIQAQAKREDEEAYCTFEVLDRYQLMDLPASQGMPKYQDLKRE